MMSMQKTCFGSRFAWFTEGSIWFKCVFSPEELRYKNYTPICPDKKYYDGSSNKYDKCDEICVLQMQSEKDSFLIEYVVTKEGDKSK